MARPIVLMALQLDREQKDEASQRLGGKARIHFFDELAAGEFAELVPHVEILVRYGMYKPFPDEVLRQMGKLRLIQLMSAGTQFLDEDPAVPNQARIQGARGANSCAVAEQAMAFVLTLAKSLPRFDRMIRSGLFDQRRTTHCLAESTIGILGLGSIGAEIAKRALAFGMRVQAIDVVQTSGLPLAFFGGLESLDQVLRDVDFLVLSLPLTDETHNIIGERELRLMKDDACLVNVGRGPLVNERALYEHLLAHPAFQAGLDVWWSYPTEYAGELIESHWAYPFHYPFHLLENVAMTPHMAAYSGQASHRMFQVVLARLEDELARGLI